MKLREPAPAFSTVNLFHTIQIGAIITPRAEMLTGSQRYFFDLLKALPRIGIGAQGAFVGSLPAHEAEAIAEPLCDTGTTRFERIARMRRMFERLAHGSNLIASHFAPHAFALLDVIHRQQRPLVVHFHGPWTLETLIYRPTEWRRLPLLALEEVAVYHTAKRILVLFERYADVLEHVYRLPRARIRVVSGGVDLDRFQPHGTRAAARRALNLALDRPIVMTVGRLVRAKSVPTFLAAIDLVRRTVPDVLLLVVGTGPLEPLLRAHVEARKLQRHVRFVGFAGSRLPALYRASDCVLSNATGSDGFGLIVGEANACGTPVILAPLGPRPERAPPALTFASDGSPGAVADVLVDVFRGRLRLPEEAQCTGFAAPYGWPNVAARIRTVYEEALGC